MLKEEFDMLKQVSRLASVLLDLRKRPARLGPGLCTQ
jgi:hypothetical protein